MSCYQLMCWSRSIINTYKLKHTGPFFYINIHFYCRSETKALRIQGSCCSPSVTCMSTLRQKTFFSTSSEKSSVFATVLTRSCLHSNCSVFVFQHFDIHSSRLQTKSTAVSHDVGQLCIDVDLCRSVILSCKCCFERKKRRGGFTLP